MPATIKTELDSNVKVSDSEVGEWYYDNCGDLCIRMDRPYGAAEVYWFVMVSDGNSYTLAGQIRLAPVQVTITVEA